MLSSYVGNPQELREELQALRNILDKKMPLSEQGDILPLFRTNRHLAAVLGFANASLNVPDLLDIEAQLFGGFRCDVAVGDSRAQQFTLVELEDAKPNSVFEKDPKRSYPRWASRFEKGFSQIVDWCWRLDHERAPSVTLQPIFGCTTPRIHFLLVIGRDHWLDATDQSRLEWRRRNNGVAGQYTTIWTYDQFIESAERRMAAAEQDAIALAKLRSPKA